METKITICSLLLLAIVMYHEVSCKEEDRCKYDRSNDPIYNCTECLWKKGCQWCKDQDPDPEIPRNIVRGCLRDTIPCNTAYQSKVEDDNRNRYNAVKSQIQAERGTTTRQLTPSKIPSFHTPITLNPNKGGEALFRIKISRAHPVDLYALMDLTGSMDEHRKNLAKAAGAVAAALKKETDDYRLAFGGFRDKPKTPFGGVANCPVYDVGFALDVSGSIGKADWKKEQQFTKAIAKFASISESGGRASVITFQSSADVHIKFSDHKNQPDFDRGVDNLDHSGGGTDIYRALKKALDSMFQSGNGMRHDSSKMMILITDGESPDSQFSNLRAEFQKKKITLLVVGVGNVKRSSLRKLVVDEKDLFIANNFNDLNKRFIKSVGQSICTGSTEWDYSFHHIQSFTQNVGEFTRKITASTVNGGGDDYEAGLDGLMQTIVCKDDIWTSKNNDRKARKIIVYFSDQGVHSGRDGAHAGLLKPSGYQCHLKKCTRNNKEDPEGCTSFKNAGVMSYKDQLTRDYPSFSQIRSVINQNNINMIFAVTDGIQDYYKKFATYIGQAGNVGELKEDAKQMERLIKEQYEKITRSVKVVDNKEHNPEIKVKFELDKKLSESSGEYTCPTNAGFSEDSLECTGTKNEDEIWVKAHLNVDTYTCKKNPVGTKNIHLFQFSEDQLNLDYKCEVCDCMENKVKNAEACNNQGTLACGGCTCNPGREGRLCECEEGKLTNSEECRSSNGVECSNRGTCKCGTCRCDPSRAGKCCQFPNCEKGLCGDLEESNCGGRGAKACSGGNGKCVITQDLENCDGGMNATCNCNVVQNGWASTFKGDLCDCCQSGECQNQCFNRFTDVRTPKDMCTGRGKCQCGKGYGEKRIGQKCMCNSGIQGAYCQKHEPKKVCKLLEPCAKYRMTANDETKTQRNGQWKDECKDNLNQLGFANKKDQSITRIACHELTANGTLSEFVYFSAKEALQDNLRYCELVMQNVEDPSGTWDVFQKNTKSKRMQQCVMDGTAEINCEGCHVRFYHNTIDSDQIFTPNGHKDQQEPEVYVVMHNQTEDGEWQYCLDCNVFPIGVVLVTTIGTAFAILLGILIAAIVIVNVNDYRSYKQFLSNKTEAEIALQDMENPHYVNPNLTTQNPLFQQTE